MFEKSEFEDLVWIKSGFETYNSTCGSFTITPEDTCFYGSQLPCDTILSWKMFDKVSDIYYRDLVGFQCGIHEAKSIATRLHFDYQQKGLV